MKGRILMNCKRQGRIQKIQKGVAGTLKKSQKKVVAAVPSANP